MILNLEKTWRKLDVRIVWKNNALALGLSIKEHVHGEYPLRHEIAYLGDDVYGYYSDGYGFLAQNKDDVCLIANDRSEYNIMSLKN